MSTSQSNVVSAPLDPQKNSSLEFDIANLAAKYELTQQEIDVLSQQQVITQAMTASESPESKYIDYAVLSREGEMAALMSAGGDPFLPSSPNTSFFAPPSFTIYQEFGTHEFKCVNPLVIVDGEEVAVDTSSFDGSDGVWVCKVRRVSSGGAGPQCKAELVKESASEGGSEGDLLGAIKIVELSASELQQFHTGAIIFRGAPFDQVSIDENAKIPGGSEADTRYAAAIMNWHDRGYYDANNSLVKMVTTVPDSMSPSPSYQVVVRDVTNDKNPPVLKYLPLGDGLGGAVDDVSIYEYEKPISGGSGEKIKCHAIHNWHDVSDYDVNNSLVKLVTADPQGSSSSPSYQVVVRDVTNGQNPTLKYLPLGDGLSNGAVDDVSIYEYEKSEPGSADDPAGEFKKTLCHAIYNWYEAGYYDTKNTLTEMLTYTPGGASSSSSYQVVVRDVTDGQNPTLKYLPLGYGFQNYDGAVDDVSIYEYEKSVPVEPDGFKQVLSHAIFNWHRLDYYDAGNTLAEMLTYVPGEASSSSPPSYQVVVRDVTDGQNPTLKYLPLGNGLQASGGAVDDVSIYEYEKPISGGSGEKIKCHAIHNWYDTSDYDITKTLTSMLTADPEGSPSPSLFHVLVRDATSGDHPTLKYLPLGSRVEIDVVTDVRYDCESHQLQKKVVTLCLPAVVKVNTASGSPEWTCIEGGQAVSHADVISECPPTV